MPLRSIIGVLLLLCLFVTTSAAQESATPGDEPITDAASATEIPEEASSTDDPSTAPSDGAPTEADAKPDDAEKPDTEETEEPAVEAAPPPPPWGLRPYNVRVSVTFARQPQLAGIDRQLLYDKLKRRLLSRLGLMWEISIGPELHLPASAFAQLDDVPDETFFAAYDGAADDGAADDGAANDGAANDGAANDGAANDGADFDKVFVLHIADENQRLHARVREWDHLVQLAGPTQHRQSSEPDQLVRIAVDAILASFRPLLMFEGETDGMMEATVRAGEFLATGSDPQPFDVVPGKYFVPCFRLFDRDRKLRRIQRVDWTFFGAVEVMRSRVVGHVASPFGNPLAARRRRTEAVAILTRPWHDETKIEIVPRDRPRAPMVGTKIELLNDPPTRTEPDPPKEVFLTDYRGYVTLPADRSHPLKYMQVRRGPTVLARVPFVPGAVERLKFAVPDNMAILLAEGELSIIEAELIDTVARQSVLLSAAMAAAKKDKWQTVDEHLATLDELPTKRQFDTRVTTAQGAALDLARQSNDRKADREVRKMCEKVGELVNHYLDPNRIKSYLDDIRDLRSVSEVTKQK